MYGADATNEIGSAYLYVTETPQALPTPLFSAGAHKDTKAGPRHALISVEGGDVRYRLDGTDVVEPFGVLAKDGTLIDWTDPMRNFAAFINNMSVIAVSGTPLLNISWRD